MRFFKLAITIFAVIGLLVACSDDSSDGNQAEGSNNQQELNEEGSDAEGDGNADSVKVHSLGETGTMEDTLGTYEITPNSFEFVDTADGELPGNGIFVVVDITIKNIGDEELEAKDIGKADLFDSEGIRMPSLNYYNFVDNFTGPIAPGEEMTAQLVFDHASTDDYELVFGYALSSVSNELKWEFSADEAE